MTSDNHLLTMTRCGNGKALQMNPSLLKYTLRGHLVAVIPLQLPLLIKSKLRFMALSGNSLYISDLGMTYYCLSSLSLAWLTRSSLSLVLFHHVYVFADLANLVLSCQVIS